MPAQNVFLLSFFFILIIQPAIGQSQIDLEQIWKSGTYRSKGIEAFRSTQDGTHYTLLTKCGEGQCIVKYAYASGEAVDTLLNTEDVDEGLRFSSYEFSPNEKKLLLATDEEPIYRRSSKANYYAYDIPGNTLKPITDFQKGKQQLAAFSPTENKVAFVRENDVYISDLDAGKETQITTDGKWGSIINGAVDWVYEEEFGFARGFYWSPKGSQIAYYKFDESEVKEFNLSYYEELYPRQYDFKYPKAGEKNAEVRVFVYSLGSKKSVEVALNAEKDQYIPRIKWSANDTELAIIRMTRLQNELEILLASTDTDESPFAVRPIYTEQSETYIDINDNLIFLDDQKHFIWNSEKDGYNHLYIYDLDGKEIAQLTRGNWEVVDFYGVSQAQKMVYFSAALDPLAHEICGIGYDKALRGKKAAADNRNQLVKLTSNGEMNKADFSESFDYFINTTSNANRPAVISLFNSSGKKLRVLEDNKELATKIEGLDIAPKEFGTFKTTGGIPLNYWMIKPADFDPAKTYPLMFMVYGGPGHNTVVNSWDGSNYFWHQMLAQQGHILVSVDPRGTMYRGRDFKHSTYMQNGKLEIEDLINAAKHFGAETYVDQNRIGIMGWSYGGYMSSLAMTKGADYFQLGIAVAPVTNWRYYDSIYTERFFRTPQENAPGYDDNSPINYVERLKGKYLLVHGSTDDNVHLQNTMEMVKALVAADKQFDLFIYPNKNHGIYGGNTRFHLYTMMTDFITKNL